MGQPPRKEGGFPPRAPILEALCMHPLESVSPPAVSLFEVVSGPAVASSRSRLGVAGPARPASSPSPGLVAIINNNNQQQGMLSFPPCSLVLLALASSHIRILSTCFMPKRTPPE